MALVQLTFLLLLAVSSTSAGLFSFFGSKPSPPPKLEEDKDILIQNTEPSPAGNPTNTPSPTTTQRQTQPAQTQPSQTQPAQTQPAQTNVQQKPQKAHLKKGKKLAGAPEIPTQQPPSQVQDSQQKTRGNKDPDLNSLPKDLEDALDQCGPNDIVCKKKTVNKFKDTPGVPDDLKDDVKTWNRLNKRLGKMNTDDTVEIIKPKHGKPQESLHEIQEKVNDNVDKKLDTAVDQLEKELEDKGGSDSSLKELIDKVKQIRSERATLKKFVMAFAVSQAMVDGASLLCALWPPFYGVIKVIDSVHKFVKDPLDKKFQHHHHTLVRLNSEMMEKYPKLKKYITKKDGEYELKTKNGKKYILKMADNDLTEDQLHLEKLPWSTNLSTAWQMR